MHASSGGWLGIRIAAATAPARVMLAASNAFFDGFQIAVLVEALRQRRPPGCVEVRRDAQGRTDRALRAVRDRSRNAGRECIRQAA